MGISCQEVWREVSNYLEDNLDPVLRATIEEHLQRCKHCTAVIDGTRNVVQLYGDRRMLEVPLGFSQRLHARLQANMPPPRPRGTAWGWVFAAAASLLIVGGFELGNSAAFTGPELRSEHAIPATNHMPPDLLVVVAKDGKVFHGAAACPFMHDKNKERVMKASEAIREGYVPCTRCMKQYLSANLIAPSFQWGIMDELAGMHPVQ
ncbi:MAG TPA: zf-HC2 domain-containing protein [Terriglobales bacterium]|nr:zf-HC2 domain-containing protein [Terriglobales bacterium]